MCAVDGCESVVGPSGRGICKRHYAKAYRSGTLLDYPAQVNHQHDGWVNPLVCVCPEPDADPRRDFGMCQSCFRKPLALMAVPV